jgi:hypothetical protein
MNATPKQIFLAGMCYGAGPRRTHEIINDDAAQTDIALILERLIGVTELAMTGEELWMEHKGWTL